MNIYVGNLPYSTTEAQLTNAFAEFGTVTSVKLITDKATGQAKGFAFVEMENDNEATKAISALNEADFNGRNLRVNEAKPREENGERGHGGGGGFRNRQQRPRNRQ